MMSKEKVCVNCEKPKEEHFCSESRERLNQPMRYQEEIIFPEVEEIIFPEGCVCIKETWEHDPPKVCDKFKSPKFSQRGEKGLMCSECFHDEECHD